MIMKTIEKLEEGCNCRLSKNEYRLNEMGEVIELKLPMLNLVDLSFISEHSELIWLYLDRNNIDDISPLRTLTRLKTLTLNANNISDISPIVNLISLHLLDMSDNKIENVMPLEKLTNLKWLDLARNKIKDIDPLFNLNISKFRFEKKPYLGKESIINIYDNPITEIIPEGYVIDKNELIKMSLHSSSKLKIDDGYAVVKNVPNSVTQKVDLNNGKKEHSSITISRKKTESQPVCTKIKRTGYPKELTILSIATEWFSRHGGISTFNRELCCSLSRVGQRVICLVPTSSDQEKKSAKESDVLLVNAPSTTIEDKGATLFRRPQLPTGYTPDVIIGHGRITGPYAEAQVADNFKDALRIHFVHMVPGEIEWYKGKDEATKTAEERERIELNLCRKATIVAAVGPQIFRETGTLIHCLNPSPKVHQFIPGINNSPIARGIPPGIQCLILGRAEDMKLKGLDIAAKAFAKLPHPDPRPFDSEPVLIVRGAPAGTGVKLRNTLLKIAEKQIKVRIYEYSPNIQFLYEDLQRASIVLMPSRSEGFGLVAAEALSFKTPILVSHNSGFGELLVKQIDLSEVSQYVVRTTGNLSDDSVAWSNAIEFILRDRRAAFERANKLCDQLSIKFSWDNAARELLNVLKNEIP